MNEIKIRDMSRLSEYTDSLRKKPQLTYLFFELTDSCNLACMHCGSSCETKNKVYLDYSSIVKVIDSVADKYNANEIMICLTGGEPMLHPKFYDVARYATSKGFSCGITTNGTLITKENANKIIESGISSVMISIDGKEESHNWLRNNQSAFGRTIDGINNLKAISKGKCVIAATTVVHKRNISELEEVYDFISDLGINIWRLVNIEPIGRAEKHSNLMLSPTDYKYLMDFIREKRFLKNRTIDVTFGCSHYVTLEYERMIRDTYFICGSGLYVASVLSNGDIYSCLDIERRKELVQGNIYKDDFVDIWENKFDEFRRDRSTLCDECKVCDERKFCQGDSAHTWDYDNCKPKLCLKKILEEEI